MDKDLVLLHEKIDFLTEQMTIQRQRQDELDELKQDLIPIANHLMKLSIDELAEIGRDFQLEDLFFLLKRLLRNTHVFLDLMDRMESLIGLADEANVIGQEVFNQTVETLDRMERQGYFSFLEATWRIFERVVEDFGEEELDTLGDNIIAILSTIQTMTQPEILGLANNAVTALSVQPAQEKPPSAWGLLQALSDPKMRLGMVRMLNMVRAMADQPETAANPQSRDNN